MALCGSHRWALGLGALVVNWGDAQMCVWTGVDVVSHVVGEGCSGGEGCCFQQLATTVWGVVVSNVGGTMAA